MTTQEAYEAFKERFADRTGRIALREHEGVIHAYPMRGFHRGKQLVPPGFPMCGIDLRFIAARALPTADAPTCTGCISVIEKALG